MKLALARLKFRLSSGARNVLFTKSKKQTAGYDFLILIQAEVAFRSILMHVKDNAVM